MGRIFVLLGVCLAGLGLSACGGGPRQDVTEPTGKFPVDIIKSEFPTRQQLAGTVDLQLGVRNIGSQTIPDLAITISTDPNADTPFTVRSQQPGLAIPSRPVWILENGYPKLAGEAASAGASVAQTKTYGFGPVDPSAVKLMVWRLTPVVAGTYTVKYEISAGLNGKAVAVTGDGSVPQGEFVVKISDTPPQTRVDNSGKVVPITPNDIIGQAGTQQQKQEVGGGTGTTTTKSGK